VLTRSNGVDGFVDLRVRAGVAIAA
jgi:hypothetical protein